MVAEHSNCLIIKEVVKMQCYFCEFREADQHPSTDCPVDCTVMELLKTSALFYKFLRPSVGLGIVKALEDEAPQMKALFEEIGA